jgi:hypothetical protein
MARIKNPTPKLRIAHWSVLLLALVFIAAAIYAMTTWSDSKRNFQSSRSSPSPAANSLKVNAQPSAAADVNNNPAPAQSAMPTAGGQNTQPSAPALPGTNYDYPPNPDPCADPRQERPCIQY